jgi:hypothetical protein
LISLFRPYEDCTNISKKGNKNNEMFRKWKLLVPYIKAMHTQKVFTEPRNQGSPWFQFSQAISILIPPWKTSEDGKISHARGSAESILWKMLLYQKHSMCLLLCTQNQLNISPETLKQLQEVVGNTLEHICIGNNFLNRTPLAQQLRERMNNRTASN